MQTYLNQTQAGLQPDWRIKEALLCGVGHLESQIHKEKDGLAKQMEPMLITHVLHELKSA